MPKKDEKQKKAAAYPTQSSYPTQASLMAAPPQQPVYGAQPAYNPAMQAGAPYSSGASPYAPMPGMPPPPPSYDQAMHHPVAPNNYVPNQQWGQVPAGAPYYGQGYPQAMPGYAQPNPYQQPQQIHVHQVRTAPATFVVPGAFDAGARFDSSSQPTIPPPPPGIAPNSAQLAQASGHNVVVSQRPDKWFTGGSSGGAVLW